MRREISLLIVGTSMRREISLLIDDISKKIELLPILSPLLDFDSDFFAGSVLTRP